MKKYLFKPYSSLFPFLFERERERIFSKLPSSRIEHVGSTAVPDLGGKGIIDLAIAVSKSEMEEAKGALQALGYEYRPSCSTPDRFYFIVDLPDPEEGSRRYHVHLTYPEHQEWKEMSAFRDYLRDHATMCQEYAELKRRAALEANQEGERYRKIKEPIFEKVRKEIERKSSN